MGGFLAVSARDAREPAAFARARAWMDGAKGLPVTGAVPGAVQYGRLAGSARALAASERGWLCAAGTWVHPSCADGGALLAHLAAKGPGALEDMEGMYALAWHDAASGRLTVAPDFLGRLHVFAAETAEGALVGTSAAALGAAIGAEPDPEGVFEFLAGGVLYGERTLFRGVRRLLGGRRHAFRGGAAEPPSAPRLLPGGEGDAARLEERLLECFDGLLPRFMELFRDPLADLTGGLDSRLVHGLLARAGAGRHVTVSGGARDGDVRVARALAARLGLELHVVEPATTRRAQGDFGAVLRAARRAENYDAAEYAGIAAVHEAHAGRFGASVNGSGGEVFRNYWWDGATCDRRDLDAVAAANRRFAGNALRPEILDEPWRRDPLDHYAGVLRASLAARPGAPFHVLLDHAYLDLRMQCWQGAIASATNQLWPNVSPLLWRHPLEVLFAAPPHVRLGHRLAQRLFARFGGPYATVRLDSGFPPCAPSLANAWRFLPGLLALPFRLGPRVAARLRGGPPPSSRDDVATARTLLESGARDYLAPREMRTLPLLDRQRYEAWLDGGALPLPLLGRLIAAECALRGPS